MSNNKLLIIGIASVLVFFANIWGSSIYILDEAKNATCAREMLIEGDLITPTFNYELRTDKPPLHYYFMMTAYKLFGVNEFAARFFSAICGCLTVLLTFFFTRKLLNESVAFYSSMALLASLQVAVQFHLAVPDPYLILLINLSLFSFLTGFSLNQPKYFYLSFIAMGFAVLAKGPVAIVLPGAVVFLFLLFTKQLTWKNILYIKPFAGIALLLAICLPWYLAVHFKTGGAWTEGFFLKHNIERFSKPMEAHGGPFFLPYLFIILGLLPFSVFVVQALKNSWVNRQKPILVFAMIVVGVFGTFFAVSSTKLPSYPAPCFPFMAVILGAFLDSEHFKKRNWHIKTSYYVFAVLLTAIPVGIYIALSQEKYLSHISHVAFGFVPATLVSYLTVYFYHKSNWQKSFWAMVISFWCVTLPFFYFAFPIVDRENPVVSSLNSIVSFSNTTVVSYKAFNPSYSFYLKKPIEQYHSVESLKDAINKEEELFVITRHKYIKDIKELSAEKVFERRDLFEGTTTVVLRLSKDKSMSLIENQPKD